MTMPDQKGAFFVIEGVDGSGKSTIARALAAAMSDVPVIYSSHKEIATGSPAVEQGMRQLADLLWPKEQKHLASLPSEYRVLLHAAWFSIFSDCVIKPRLDAGTVFILDGWYYKMMARLRIDGYSREYLNAIFSCAAEPDEIIFLDPPVEEVWARMEAGGRSFGPVEMGLYGGYEELGRESFLSYQARTRDMLKALAVERNRRLVDIKEIESIEETVSAISLAIRERLNEQGRQTVPTTG